MSPSELRSKIGMSRPAVMGSRSAVTGMDLGEVDGKQHLLEFEQRLFGSNKVVEAENSPIRSTSNFQLEGPDIFGLEKTVL
ncbi:uncharacterized protein A4U43_C09F7930 [Asparagus officinalis]|uniref:Uncharacterized protein n=1 Tax=Asparagus officinalis TaxID=4686 RepID=A0A5P1E622_ASPOF|nr:uncharacterized protein A4U43_C09F7930 [Asparagus officinalis]